jgi:hypothetical protein
MPSPLPQTQGAEEAARWLLSLGLPAIPRWHAEIELAAGIDTRFELNIYAEEWGFVFHHHSRGSWIRITDTAIVHGRDDFGLVRRTPELLAISVLAADLEAEYRRSLDRADATIRTNIPNGTDVIREWLLQSMMKKTVEPCGNLMHDGIHCSKVSGHEGDHEYLGHDGRSQLRWR